MGWGPRTAKGGQHFENMPSLWRHLQKTPHRNRKIFFIALDYKTCWIRGWFEQLSTSIAWRVIGLQSSARKVTHAGLKGNQQDVPRQFLWGILDTWPNQRSCDLSIQRSGSTFRALQLSQLRTLSRSVTPGVYRGGGQVRHNASGAESLGEPKSPNNVASFFFYTVHLLPNGLRFNHGSAKHVSHPGDHLTWVHPCVALWTLRKNPISAAFTWDDILAVVTEDSWPQVRIGTKTELKTDSFAVLENSHFVNTEPQSSRRTMRQLCQSVYQSPCSTCYSALLLTCRIHSALGLKRDIIPRFTDF